MQSALGTSRLGQVYQAQGSPGLSKSLITSSPFQGIRQDGNPEWVREGSKDINQLKVRAVASLVFILQKHLHLKIIPPIILSFKMLETSVSLASLWCRHVLLRTRQTDL